MSIFLHNLAPEISFFFLKFDLSGHTQGQGHLHHQEKYGRTSVTDEGQCDTCGRNQIDDNTDIQNDLKGYVRHDPHYHQRTEQIRCILGDKKQTVDQISEQKQYDRASENPKFLTDNEKIISF